MTSKGDEQEAQMMTAMLSGFIFAGLQNLKDVLVQPIEWRQCDPDGTIAFKLASGMTVTISVVVSPVGEV